jgi:hypothetical protein
LLSWYDNDMVSITQPRETVMAGAILAAAYL